ncbi:uncharacterized protein LOC117652539 [Thrips palmi]|uniref:Uncharacterized protein LOC117652539 n=1 Tax=Thrips palmi TaxID=161013 RepID=A0A6P9ABR4_THRPL|nr:uncharacterized protein LOC117652539 [Thrips palmi]
MASTIYLSMLLLCAVCYAAEEQGPALERCTQDDPNVNECLRKAIQSAIRSLKDGYAPLGMVPLDPLVIEQLVLLSPENAKCDLNKYDVVGLTNVICEEASFVVTGDKSFRLTFDLLLPQFDAAGTYSMEKGFLGNKKPNQGSFTFNLTEYRANFVLDGALSTASDGQEYATLTGVSSSFNGGINPRVHFENLSQGRNKLWNRAPQGVLQGYKTAIDQLHPILAQTYSNLLFQNVPFAYLFPPTKTAV